MARLPDPALRQWWRELISQPADSGMTIAQFCDAHRISTASFYLWRRKLQDDPPAQDGFLSVQVVGTTNPSEPFRVHLLGGAVIEIPNGNDDVLLGIVEQLTRLSGPVGNKKEGAS